MKNVVFLPNINLKDNRSNSYHYSAKSWEFWCSKNDTLFIEWTEPIFDPKQMPIILQRDWVFDILKHNKIEYDQILIVDADTIVHPDCPNFFKETNYNYSAVVNSGCYEWILRSIKGWGDNLFKGEPKVKQWNYFNTGFVIVNEKHELFFDDVKEFYLSNIDRMNEVRRIVKASTGQTVVNYLLQKHEIEVTKMPDCYNLQDLYRKNLLYVSPQCWWSDKLHFADAGWVYHFNAIPPNPLNRGASYWIERTYKELFEK